MRDLAEGMSDLSPAAEPVMSARGLRYGTGRKTHLGPLDLEIRAGRSTVIMGANGAGKSVLIRLLHGLLAPTRGQILWHGAALNAGTRKRQAMVFQRPVLLRRSVLGNLRFALRVRGIGKGDRVARERAALDAAKLSHAGDRPARRLSIGEQQRLAVARALSTGPELLFLDEPTASLDPASTLAIEAQIAEAKASGVTIVLVTHDAGQARRVGDDVIFLDAGRIAEQGRASDVLTTPQSPEAQAWLSGDLRLAASGSKGL